MARKKQNTTGEVPIPEAARPAYEAVADLIDAFCREHLNEEYRVICRKLAGTLARKRPSPLLSGKPATWACGIVRTIGWVNFLDDRSRQPHMTLTAIDKAFGVAESTGQGKSKAIRTMLKIRSFDLRWTLPSRMDETRRAFTVEIDGSLVEFRGLKQAFDIGGLRKALISIHPADRTMDDAAEE
jgi:hypothetical protein